MSQDRDTRIGMKPVRTLAPEQIRHLFPTYANLELDEAQINALSLPKQAELLTTLPYRQKYQLLRLSDETVRLLRQMSPEDVFFTVEAAGRTDAMDLMLSTTPEQFTHILDMTCWDRDDFDPEELLDWLGYMIQVDPERAMGKLRTLDTNLIMLMLARFIRVRRIEWSDNREEISDDVVSLDDFFQFEFVYPESSQNERLGIFLKMLYTLNHELYKTLMESLIWELPTHLEEHNFRARCDRMSDRGYPEYLDALGIFARLDPEVVKRRLVAAQPEARRVRSVNDTLPVFYGELLDERSFLARTLAHVPEGEQESFRNELIHLANRLLVARRSLTDLDRVKDALSEVRHTLSLGLDFLADSDPSRAALLLFRSSMLEVFRVGYWLVMGLHSRANGLSETHLDAMGQKAKMLIAPQARETLTALLRKPPVYFTGADPEAATLDTRPFASVSDLRHAERLLGRTEFLFDLHFGALALDPGEILKGVYDVTLDELDPDIRFAKVFLTTYLNAHLGGDAAYRPLSRAQVMAFLGEALVSQEGGYRLREDVAARLSAWLAGYTQTRSESFRENAEQWVFHVCALFDRLASEIKGLDARQTIGLSRLLLMGG